MKSILLGLLTCASAVSLDGLALDLPITPGPFSGTMDSLTNYSCPAWFRDAKFGIWAHWGAQCQPKQGDWYARNMYMPGHGNNKWHVEHYGDPAQFGFKDVINAQGFNEGKPFSADDVRFTTKGKTLYAITLGAPKESVTIKSLAAEKIAGIILLGSNEKIQWKQTADVLTIDPPATKPSDIAVVFKLTMK